MAYFDPISITRRAVASLLLVMFAGAAAADPPLVTGVNLTQAPSGQWRFDVTLTHPDSGWDHYADGWRIEDASGNQLGLRALAHPHVDEQPFTRSLAGVAIPDDIAQVYVRARCNIDGWSDAVFQVTLK